jgi:hypothetical protein
LAGRGSREVRELTLDRFLPKIGPGAVSSGAGGVEALDRPPLLLLLGAGASWRPGSSLGARKEGPGKGRSSWVVVVWRGKQDVDGENPST